MPVNGPRMPVQRTQKRRGLLIPLSEIRALYGLPAIFLNAGEAVAAHAFGKKGSRRLKNLLASVRVVGGGTLPWREDNTHLFPGGLPKGCPRERVAWPSQGLEAKRDPWTAAVHGLPPLWGGEN